MRARTTRWRGWAACLASVAATLGMAFVPSLGATPAGAAGPAVTTITGHAGATAPSLGVPAPSASAQISPTYVAHAANGDTRGRPTKAGSVFVYLIAAAAEANEYNIQTAPSPVTGLRSPHRGRCVHRRRHRDGRADRRAGQQPVRQLDVGRGHGEPDRADIGGLRPQRQPPHRRRERSGDSAIQVVAKTTGTFYGVSMTAGDLYTIADVGVSGAPATAINMGDVAAVANGMSVDPAGNIVVGDGDGAYFVNEQSLGQPQPLRPDHPAPVGRRGGRKRAGWHRLLHGCSKRAGKLALLPECGALHRRLRQRLLQRQRNRRRERRRLRVGPPGQRRAPSTA